MIGNLAAGIEILLTPTNILLIMFAVIVGIVAGAIPGFTGTNTVAIVLPFTLAMTPETAIVFMAAIYVGANYGGAIPAALINTPGTAGATATVLDAYPMSKKGKAGQAIGISILASGIGGIISAIVIVALLNPLGSVALMFGQPEYFALALFGIIALASVLGENVRKGLISGLLGLLIAAVTLDPITGQSRLDFGFPELVSDVPFVPIIVGLFAISELMYLIKKRQISDADFDISSMSEVKKGAKQVLARPFQTLRAISIGTLIGAIPGAGTSVANFISWGEAKRASDKPEEFGDGSPEGVIASEGSNNAVTSSSLLPTLVLGIPGSGTTAVMLGALLLHGIQPGPNLMAEFGAEATAIMLSLLIANLVLIAFAFAISKYIVRVVLLPTEWLVPVILVLTAIGIFSLNNSLFEVRFMILFGILGFIMREYDYSLIPMVLGVILGPLAEGAFRRTLELGNGDVTLFFINSPITVILWVLIVAVFFSDHISRFFKSLLSRV
ncbi:tripartite tricarboxylate transporter permease [Natrialbaceae archaeon AArc-T1-2]|uniref:tripartite tricarboxylate transporter permease n=1 Tax=Natrialbaceae archaeon AArc-T1-2 TaxID=3053904 RepID=UPI00255AE962|nr:tripartite tricarboxylate transporter permease [Natrialbaceae archaeon AArc-T1-2]WIV65907.1 tripartite tricarboxylate transporter permease [Natrialbaceae archaeon AArc-T1-2]